MNLLSTRAAIGLEIKDYVIRYVDGKKAAAPLVSSFGEVYMPPGIIKNGLIADEQAFEAVLRSCVQRWGLRKKQVHFIVPDAYVIVRKQLIPADITEEEIRGYIFLELGHSIHLPFDSPTFDYVVIGEQDNKKEVLLFAAPENLVQSYANMLEKVKLRPVSADLTSLSLSRLYHHMEQPPSGEEVLMVKADAFEATITIFCNQNPVFMQTESLVYGNAAEVAQSGIILQDKEEALKAIDELLEEIDRILHFYKYSFRAGQDNIQKMVLVGDHPLMEEIYMIMRNHFSFIVDPMYYSNVIVPDDRRLPPKYYPVLGLALKGV
ncbi:MAG: type IV pilus biogenesis protein PilM [Ectobacillus sp.]